MNLGTHREEEVIEHNGRQHAFPSLHASTATNESLEQDLSGFTYTNGLGHRSGDPCTDR